MAHTKGYATFLKFFQNFLIKSIFFQVSSIFVLNLHKKHPQFLQAVLKFHKILPNFVQILPLNFLKMFIKLPQVLLIFSENYINLFLKFLKFFSNNNYFPSSFSKFQQDFQNIYFNPGKLH